MYSQTYAGGPCVDILDWIQREYLDRDQSPPVEELNRVLGEFWEWYNANYDPFSPAESVSERCTPHEPAPLTSAESRDRMRPWDIPKGEL